MSHKDTYEKFLKKVALVHNSLVLSSWLYLEVLIVYHFYKHLYNGFKLDLSQVHTLNLWQYLDKDFKYATLFNTFNLLFYLDKLKGSKTFLSVLFHHLKGLLMYFVTFKLLEDSKNFRWSLVNLTVWTLLNVLESASRFNLYVDNKNEFFEWLYYKVFMFLYPLQSVSEVMLLTSSFPYLKNYSKFKSFPSPMPNPYNFSANLHLLYKSLPLPWVFFSTLEYFNKFKNS